jgi:hypothetical protein
MYRRAVNGITLDRPALKVSVKSQLSYSDPMKPNISRWKEGSGAAENRTRS